MITLLNCKPFRHMASLNRYLYNILRNIYAVIHNSPKFNCLIFRNEAKFNTGIPPSGSAH